MVLLFLFKDFGDIPGVRAELSESTHAVQIMPVLFPYFFPSQGVPRCLAQPDGEIAGGQLDVAAVVMEDPDRVPSGEMATQPGALEVFG